MHMNTHLIQRSLLSLFLAPALFCLSAWAMDDANFDDFEERIEAVNEGELEFLNQPPMMPVHHHQNHITITAESLVSGWIKLQQCHHQIDPVARAQVVYNDSYTRKLSIISHSGIDKAWVEGATIQLGGIHQAATLCVTAETRAFRPDDEGGFILRNGPYMRRFLDGYYPMHVSLSIQYPDQLLRFRSSNPVHQPGFQVQSGVGELNINTWFEGRLITELHFDHNI